MPRAAAQRKRLAIRLEGLKKQHSWGDVTDAEDQAERNSIRIAMASLPDDDRIRSFDAYRTRVLELPGAIVVASPFAKE